MSKQTLPIDSFLPEITRAMNDHASVILVAEPGAGKTTRVPVALSNVNGSKWIVLQPRRWAARLTATRIAEENGWKLGEEVGYQVRFESKASRNTRVLLMTEGILLRRLMESPELEGYAGIVLDEFHERSLDLDLSLALLKEIQSSFRPDLKILVMSATLDPAPLQKFLPDSETFQIPGRTFPVEKRYLKSENLLEAIRDSVDTDGDILVFLPGSFEIERACGDIREELRKSRNDHFDVYPLYATLPEEKQKAVFQQTKRQKIICSTNIAETSLTLPNVKVVIDSGLSKVMRMDPQMGIDKLETLRISRASSEQRAGRAGRVSSGLCIRLWSEGEHQSLRHFETPEIHRVNLSRALLTLSEFGVSNFGTFDWFEKPKSSMLDYALRELEELRFFKAGKRTELGEMALKLPLEPRFAAIVLASRKYGQPHFGARFCAFLENGASRENIRDEEQLLRRLNRLMPVEQRSAEQILGSRELQEVHSQDWSKYEEILIESNRARIVINEKMVGRRKTVAKEGKLPKAAIVLSAFERGDIQALSWVPIEYKKLESYGEKRRRVFWDEDAKRVRALEGMFFEDLELGNLTESPVSKEEAGSALRTLFLKNPEAWLLKNETFEAWWKRVQFWNKHMPEEPFVLPWEDIAEVLIPGKTRLEEVVNQPLVEIIEGLLPRDQLQRFEDEVPAKLEVPSGSFIRLEYDSDPPRLSVRLQEVFGWLESPKLLNGRVPILMELLSPGFKAMQLTRDLKSFWAGTYFEIKKELKARYPKHAWPEDPLTAKPEAKGRRRT